MKYLIASLVGAVIGYFTNWLAIKMLFKPYEEKRIFGFKLPFTPGLIPKERGRIAKSVGETVGTHLVTGEEIKKALSGEKMSKQLQIWIDNNISGLKNSTLSIGEKIKGITGDKYNDIISGIENKLTKLVLVGLREEKARKRVLSLLEDYITDELKIPTRTLLDGEYIVKLKSNILAKLETIKNSEEFKKKLELYIGKVIKEAEVSDKRIDEVLPEGIITGIKSYIYNNRVDISSGIGEMLKQPDIESRIKKVISSIISANLSPMIAMFINPDMIYGKLSSALEEYLLEDENQRNVAMTINQGFDRIIKNNIAEIFSNLEVEEKEDNIKETAQFIINHIITKEFLIDIITNIEDSLKRFNTLEDILLTIDLNFSSILNSFLEDKINFFILSERFEIITVGFIKQGMENILSTKISSLICTEEGFNTEMTVIIVKEIFDKFVENEATELVEVLNIPQIVEERINSFDVKFAENIIIDISKKELNAITWLGGLLGGLIGILSPLLERLY
jgi:uncharacterized membrane protein YheB (UPF0754 family)